MATKGVVVVAAKVNVQIPVTDATTPEEAPSVGPTL